MSGGSSSRQGGLKALLKKNLEDNIKKDGQEFINHLKTNRNDVHIWKEDDLEEEEAEAEAATVAAEMQPVTQYLGLIVTPVAMGNSRGWKLSELGANIIRGITTSLVNDMSHQVIRPNVSINQIYANDKEVEIRAEAMRCENKSSYTKVLMNMICIIHCLCGSKRKSIPLDLQHMMFYFTDYKLFWNNRRFLINHPCLWNFFKVQQVIMNLRTAMKVKPTDTLILIGLTPNIEWKDDIIRMFENESGQPSYQQGEFLGAAEAVFYYRTYSNTSAGFIMFLGALYVHVYERWSELNKERLMGSFVVEIGNFFYILYPTFLCQLVSKLFYYNAFKGYF
ncbi:hypothetical protein QUC31_018455 [Theobroma cacao]|uniref:Uncharacterized protein isoform 1 n=1 Tax=Theobroma cacao TaxID=3641 RepID=A0A061GY69_THECC|nr:Uncharacterized protein TCM_042105 isoform 1 [Theobroma cacao]EOY34425.1 Uncharacterized protein TCM_042105 isoform 1 [Theobroma cacao]EOY34426.1 Uncharacterized protein TCM_042105 isoform 1 [Theobroma cacao]